MKYDVAISDDGAFVWQFPRENITMELAYKMSHDAILLARSKNIHRYLSDVRGIRNISSVFKNYEFAYREVAAVGYTHTDKIAVVRDIGDNSHDFIETASINAGYRVKLFTELNEAIDWLRA